jgi:hypothetical protein
MTEHVTRPIPARHDEVVRLVGLLRVIGARAIKQSLLMDDTILCMDIPNTANEAADLLEKLWARLERHNIVPCP